MNRILKTLKPYFSAPLLALFTALAISTGLSSSSHADYLAHPDVDDFINTMVEEHQFSREEIVDWLKVAKHQKSIVDAMSRPAEKVKPWYQYRKHFISEARIKNGVKFWQENRETLGRAEKELGVDPAIIVSIIGVETNYGGFTGNYKVIDALATLAFDFYTNSDEQAHRKRFFTGEIENLFLLAREHKLNPLELEGSYAGAMGLGQFMPSSYRNYAIDFDNDQFADIWANTTDAIGSVANYFARHGWRKGEAVATRANISSDPDESLLNKLHRPKITVAELTSQGYKTLEPLPADAKALPLRFEAKYGNEYWLGLHNFYVIGRYNPRTKYAMAVYQLSEMIRERYCAQSPGC